MEDFRTTYGPWALVTGASSGIGREFARALAGRGLDLVLAARRIDRLESLADELTRSSDVSVRPVQVDLSRPDGVQRLDEATSDLEVGLAVSNAGAIIPGSFLHPSAETQAEFVQLNATTPMQISHLFGGRMAERGRGGIVLVSSTSAFNGVPYLANYAAVKAYQLVLGEALHTEFAAKGVDLLVLAPGPTRTEMADTEGIDFAQLPMKWMSPEDVVAAALRALGRKAVVVPGATNRVMRLLTTRVMPRRASVALWGSMMRRAADDALIP